MTLKHQDVKAGVEIGISLIEALNLAEVQPFDMLNMKVIDFLAAIAPHNIRFVYEKKDEDQTY